MSQNRIMVVEDDINISQGISLHLKYAGYDYVVFENGLDVVNYLTHDHNFDLALLDIMLPGIDGFEIIEHFKMYNIPVIFLTAKSDSASEIKGLRDGAEDYIVKPFEVVTLLVRIEKVLERAGKLNKILRVGDVLVDVENHLVTKCGVAIELAPLEFEVLALLSRNKNRTVPRERILNEVWGVDYFGDTHTVDVRIANIRKKLGLVNLLKTISKVGYRLEEHE